MNPANDPGRGRDSPAIRRLHRWMNDLGVGRHSFVNVHHQPGVFRPTTAEIVFLTEVIMAHTGPILALGGDPSRVLKRIRVPHFRLPHPSPRNRLLNDPAFEARVLDECKEWLRT